MDSKVLSKKYYLKNSEDGTFGDVTEMFNGVNILSVTGLDSKGKTVNVYTAQWQESQKEDFIITGDADATGKTKIIRENVDIVVTFIVGRRYGKTGTTIDEQSQFDSFIDWMTSTDIWVGSTYTGKQAHCVANDKFEPKEIHLHRDSNSYILGELTLHTLDAPAAFTAPS